MESTHAHDLSRARTAINEAALDTGRWTEALGCIAAAAGANGAAIFSAGAGGGARNRSARALARP